MRNQLRTVHFYNSLHHGLWSTLEKRTKDSTKNDPSRWSVVCANTAFGDFRCLSHLTVMGRQRWNLKQFHVNRVAVDDRVCTTDEVHGLVIEFPSLACYLPVDWFEKWLRRLRKLPLRWRQAALTCDSFIHSFIHLKPVWGGSKAAPHTYSQSPWPAKAGLCSWRRNLSTLWTSHC